MKNFFFCNLIFLNTRSNSLLSKNFLISNSCIIGSNYFKFYIESFGKRQFNMDLINNFVFHKKNKYVYNINFYPFFFFYDVFYFFFLPINFFNILDILYKYFIIDILVKYTYIYFFFFNFFIYFYLVIYHYFFFFFKFFFFVLYKFKRNKFMLTSKENTLKFISKSFVKNFSYLLFFKKSFFFKYFYLKELIFKLLKKKFFSTLKIKKLKKKLKKKKNFYEKKRKDKIKILNNRFLIKSNYLNLKNIYLLKLLK